MNNLFFKTLKGVFLGLLPGRYAIPVRYYYRKRFGYLEREFEVLDKLVGRCGVAIDVGGNYGFYSYVLSKLCSHVEYFEPNPDLACWLREYPARNININTVALSSSSRAVKLHIPLSGGRPQPDNASLNKTFNDETVIEVHARTLDDYGFSDVTFIKIDTEGHEIDVIGGAEKTIRNSMPVMLIEIQQDHLDFPAGMVFDRITGFGYDAYYYLDGEFITVSKGADGDWILPGKHIYNFIFFPVGSISPA